MEKIDLINAMKRVIILLQQVPTDKELQWLIDSCSQQLDELAGPQPAEAGKEAEELRAGIERILSEGIECSRSETGYMQVKRKLQQLLDQVDARDSLGWLERKGVKPPNTTPL